MNKIGIIGGSGLDDPDLLHQPREIEVMTPYGEPSSPLTLGQIEGVEVVILSRHGKKHQYTPGDVNYRANIQALKDNGVTHILATSACGSLRQEIDRGHFVIPDQFIDFTKKRANTFFESFGGEGFNSHTPMAEPFDRELRRALAESAREMGLAVHDKGTVVSIEGPRFSTRAESRMFRAWGADVVNMTLSTEAILANEAGIPYAAVAMSTDYDCWKEDEEPVTWKEIMEVFNSNAEKVKQLLLAAILKI